MVGKVSSEIMRDSTRRVDLPARERRPASTADGAVLRAVLDHGPVARSSIARAIGMSASSVTGSVSVLLDRGLLREVPEAAGRPGNGRPHVPLDLDTRTPAVIGVHLAVQRSTVALLDLRGRVLATVEDPIGSGEPGEVLARIAARVHELAKRNPQRDLLGLGFASGCRVSAEGVVVEHSVLGWQDVDVRAELTARVGLPVIADAHSRGLLAAEQLFGAAASRARESAVCLFAGNVVDMAFASGGTIHRGLGSGAGVMAHLPVDGWTGRCACGRSGCVQDAVSAATILQRAARLGFAPVTEFRELVDRAVAGEPALRHLFRERARLLGRAAALLIDLLDPAVLFIAEAGVRRVPGCLEELRAEVTRCSVVCARAEDVVRPVSVTQDVLGVAGGAVYLDRIFRAPVATVDALRQRGRAGVLAAV
jgi:predicted NBD/HSP70 family sugar kinase